MDDTSIYRVRKKRSDWLSQEQEEHGDEHIREKLQVLHGTAMNEVVDRLKSIPNKS